MNLIRRIIQRLTEVKFGDTDELERLYGGDFNTQGKISHAAHNDDELEVPTIVRQHLANHGFNYGGSPSFHRYSNSRGHEIRVGVGTQMNWLHVHKGSVLKSGNDLPSLVHHLTHYQQ
jgi:hypothetical protein